MGIENFTPITSTVNRNNQSSTVGAATSLGLPTDWIGGVDVMVTNDGDVTQFVEFGDSTVAASASTSVPVKSGAIMIFGVGPKCTHASSVVASTSASGKIYFSPGKGN